MKDHLFSVDLYFCDSEKKMLSVGLQSMVVSGISVNFSNYTSGVPIALADINVVLIFVDLNQKKNIKADQMLVFCSDSLWIFTSIVSIIKC